MELSALSAVVSGISRQTPYGIPVGYFEQFPAGMMSRIAGNDLSFQTRAPGFETSAASFQTQASGFQVPDGYFDGFAAQVLARIKAGKVNEDELPPIFSRISRIAPYLAPEGYFDELSPVLTVAHDRSTYRVPEGYFAELPERVLERVAEPVTAAKVIPMEHAATTGGKVLKGNWWKYASAASIAACFVLIFSWPQVGNKVGEGTMTPDLSQALHKVSDQEMQAYLDDQRTLLADPVNNSTATLDMNEGDVKSFLGDVSDNDLKQYMEEHGKADELATN